MTFARKVTYTLAAVVACQLIGCAGTGSVSGHTSVHYGAYYDPYPYWGHGGDTVVIIDPPDKPERPTKPPIAKPPTTQPVGGIGRPSPQRGRR